MIIYEANIREFQKHIHNGQIVPLINYNLQKIGIKVRDNEKNSWKNSLPAALDILNISNNDNREILCEFNIPTGKKRIDFIILGKNERKLPTAYILELKQWGNNVNHTEYNRFNVGKYYDTHPSYQAKNYKEQLVNTMGLNEDKIKIMASAYLHNLSNSNSDLWHTEYISILKKAKLFSFLDKEKLSIDIEHFTIVKEGKESKELFKSAKWKPSASFIQIAGDDSKQIKLVGSQKVIYDCIKHKIISTIKSHTIHKHVFLISGDPGSGKTLIAFKLLHLFVSDEFILQLQLMIPGQEVRKHFQKQLRSKILHDYITGSTLRQGTEVVIIDEAHKAIGRDVGHINYERIFSKLARFAIIFIDNDQVINKKGVTKEDISQIAKKNNFRIREYNIDENFRNLGERTLLDWIDNVFYKRVTQNGEFQYEQHYYVNKFQNYKVFSYQDANQFVDSYFKNIKNNFSTRITSLWHEGYYLGQADENGNPKSTFNIGNTPFIWNPNTEWWNKLKEHGERYLSTYNKNIKKITSSENRNFFLRLDKDARKLFNNNFIAYYNHIQGAEFDNIFVYIPKIFTYKNGVIIFHMEKLATPVNRDVWSYKSSSPKILNKTKNEIYKLNKKYFLNRLKVMLTRGTKSTHIFAEDEKLNNYIINKIK